MWLGLLVNAGILAAVFLYNRYWGPKPEIPKDLRKEVPEFPRANEGDPIQLIFGLVKILGPNVVWVSADRNSPITEVVDGSTVITGYEYELGLSMVCGIPVESELEPARCRRMWLADHLAWPASGHSGSMIDSPTPNPIYVQLGLDVGIHNNVAQGTAYWMAGTEDQEYPDSIKDLYDIDHSRPLLTSFRRQCVLTLTALDAAHQGFFWGLSPNFPAVAVEIKATGATNALGGYIAQIGDGDCNPVVALYRLLVQKWGGTGRYTDDQIDLPSFYDAARQLVVEQHGYSQVIYGETQARQAIGEILGQIDAILYEDQAQGKLVLKLIRDDYDTSELVSLNDANVLEISGYTTSTWAELYNRVTVRFTDRGHDYKVRPITVSNEAGIEAASGVVRSMTYDFLTVCDKVVAERLATRQLKMLSQPIVRVKLIANQVAWDVKPGDVVLWSSSEYGITDMILRVAAINPGTLLDNRVSLDCFEDRFASNHVLVDLPDAIILPFPTPSVITERLVTEAPRWMLRQIALLGGPPEADVQRAYYLAEQVDEGTTYVARAEPEDTGLRSTDTMNLQFPYSSRALAAYPRTGDSYDTATGLYLDWNADLAAILQTATAAQIRSGGRNLALLGSEFIAFESFSTSYNNHIHLVNVWRGLLDTPSADHVVGERFWLASPPWLGAVGGFGLVLDEVVDVKILPRGFFIQLSDAAADSDVLTVRMRTLLPYAPADVKLGGTRSPALLQEDDTSVTWKQRERTTDTIVRSDAVNETLDDTTYDVVGRMTNEEAWTDLHVDLNADHKTSAHFAAAGHGDMEVGVRGRRPNPAGGDDLQSWDVAALDITCANWRNLLANPRFADATITNAWTVAAGDVAQGSTGADALGKAGYYLTTDGASVGVDISQTVTITRYRPAQMLAYLDFYDYALSASTGDDTVTVDLISLDVDSNVLQTQTYGPTAPSKTHWSRHTLTISSLDPDTDKLKVRIRLNTTGSNPDSVVTEFRLRVGQITAELLTNGSFSGGALTGWTQSVSWQILSTTKYADDYYTRPNDGLSDNLFQDVTPTAGYEYGVAVLEWAQMNDAASDTGHVYLIAQDAPGANDLAITQTQPEVISPTNTWVRRRLYLQLPNGVGNIRVNAQADRVSGTPLNVCFDDFSLRIFKDLRNDDGMHVECNFDSPPIQWLPSTVAEWERRYPDIPAPDYGLWNGTSLQGSLGTEPEMVSADLESGLPGNVVAQESGFGGGPWDDGGSLTTSCLDFLTITNAADKDLRANDQTYANFDLSEPFTALVVFKGNYYSGNGLVGRTNLAGTAGWGIFQDGSGVAGAFIGDGTTYYYPLATGPIYDAYPTFAAIVNDPTNSLMQLVTPDEVVSQSTTALTEISHDGSTYTIGSLPSAGEYAQVGQIARVYLWRRQLSSAQLQSFWTLHTNPSSVETYTRVGTIGVIIGSDDDGVILARVPADKIPFVHRDALETGDETGWGALVNVDETNLNNGGPENFWFGENYSTATIGTSSAERRPHDSIVVEGDSGAGVVLPVLAPGQGAASLYFKWIARTSFADTLKARVILEDRSGRPHGVPYEFTLTRQWQEFSNDFTDWGGGIKGWDMVKIAPGGAWDAGASSRQYITGNGFVQWKATSTTTLQMCGLSYQDTNQDYTSIDYCLFTDASGNLQVYELGIFRTGTTYVSGDVLKIQRTSGTVTYKKNGTTFFTSGTSSVGNLVVDTALSSAGAMINEIRMGVNTATERGITWKAVTGVSLIEVQGTPIGSQTLRMHFFPSRELGHPVPPWSEPCFTDDPAGYDYSMEISDAFMLAASGDVYPNCYAISEINPTVEQPTFALPTNDFVVQFNSEGEFIAEGICDSISPGTEIIRLETVSPDNGTRLLYVDDNVPTFDHCDASGATIGSNGPGIDWTSEWIIRCRWCRAGLLDNVNVYAGIVGVTDVYSDYGRTSTFSVVATPIVSARVGTTDWQGILRRVTFTSREEILE